MLAAVSQEIVDLVRTADQERVLRWGDRILGADSLGEVFAE